jgi:hypothetical protein
MPWEGGPHGHGLGGTIGDWIAGGWSDQDGHGLPLKLASGKPAILFLTGGDEGNREMVRELNDTTKMT